jgi:hypothetical protein
LIILKELHIEFYKNRNKTLTWAVSQTDHMASQWDKTWQWSGSHWQFKTKWFVYHFELAQRKERKETDNLDGGVAPLRGSHSLTLCFDFNYILLALAALLVYQVKSYTAQITSAVLPISMCVDFCMLPCFTGRKQRYWKVGRSVSIIALHTFSSQCLFLLIFVLK